MDPREALRATGRRATWVAGQMRIERTYLWRLLNGQRRWTPELRQRYALALGLAEDAITFAASVASETTECEPGDTPSGEDA